MHVVSDVVKQCNNSVNKQKPTVQFFVLNAAVNLGKLYKMLICVRVK